MIKKIFSLLVSAKTNPSEVPSSIQPELLLVLFSSGPPPETPAKRTTHGASFALGWSVNCTSDKSNIGLLLRAEGLASTLNDIQSIAQFTLVTLNAEIE